MADPAASPAQRVTPEIAAPVAVGEVKPVTSDRGPPDADTDNGWFTE
jgi:hypothetical protein